MFCYHQICPSSSKNVCTLYPQHRGLTQTVAEAGSSFFLPPSKPQVLGECQYVTRVTSMHLVVFRPPNCCPTADSAWSCAESTHSHCQKAQGRSTFSQDMSGSVQASVHRFPLIPSPPFLASTGYFYREEGVIWGRKPPQWGSAVHSH